MGTGLVDWISKKLWDREKAKDQEERQRRAVEKLGTDKVIRKRNKNIKGQLDQIDR